MSAYRSSTGPIEFRKLVLKPACPLTQLINSVGISTDYSCDPAEKPFLKILEQPQMFYKFRYMSERENSHGCLYGKTYESNKSLPRTYPEVELFNYEGNALIKCVLVQGDNGFEHPHKLYVGDSEYVCVAVPYEDKYKVRFPGLSIVHTKREDITDWLFRGYDTEDLSLEERTNIRQQCENMAKIIGLNTVRLKFSAVDPNSDEEICDPIYSDTIRNLKNPSTNILRICRMSRTHGHVHGGEDVIMLVEKVIKKNIKIRFFEITEDGVQTWSELANFLESDVHHQYAIVFRTPSYVDLDIEKKVKVWVELIRPSDGETSDPKEFFYTPQPFFQRCKKRKLNSNDQHCAPVSAENNVNTYRERVARFQPFISQASSSNDAHNNVTVVDNTSPMMPLSDPMPVMVPVTPSQMNTAPLAFNDSDFGLFPNSNSEFQEYIDSAMEQFVDFEELLQNQREDEILPDSGHDLPRFQSACEKPDDRTIISKMVKQLQLMVKSIRAMDANKKETVAKTLDGLFRIRLSNGATFLHLILSSKQPLLYYVINVIHESNMSHLLNMRNASLQTILHLAVKDNLLDLIPILLSKGCDPMLEDIEGKNAIHYAVMHQECLEPLLDAIQKFDVSHSLNACNNEKQTALHCAVIYKSESSVRKLLVSGANYNARDGCGRTPLHLAAYDDCLPALHALLDHVRPEYIDEVDGRGYTALQIICDQSNSKDCYKLIKLLLDKNANPLLKHKDNNITAWKLARGKPAIRDVMRSYLAEEPEPDEDDESEDEFQSADEGDNTDDADDVLSNITQPLKKLSIGMTSQEVLPSKSAK